MGDTDQHYRHSVLTGGTSSSVRLLRLRPRILGEVLTCNLVEANLDQHPHYEALSYCWGDASDTTDILLNGKPFTITRNCSEALKRLRHPLTARTLWVDAICIDQTSEAEKMQQIPLMGSIYEFAKRVIIYLGAGDENSELVVWRLRAEYWQERQERMGLASMLILSAMERLLLGEKCA